jgi:hypothetical protein
MTCLIFFLLLSVYNFHEVTGLKRDPILKTGKKSSGSKCVGTTGHNHKKGQSRFKWDVWSPYPKYI